MPADLEPVAALAEVVGVWIVQHASHSTFCSSALDTRALRLLRGA